MSDEDTDDWGPGEITERAQSLLDGQGYPEDVPKLLELFCSPPPVSHELIEGVGVVARHEGVTEALHDYVIAAFGAYLSGEANSLDHAFGLKQRGRPRRRETLERNERIACMVALRMRKHGEALFDAALSVSEQFGVHESDVQNFYAEHKETAETFLVFHELEKDCF